MIGEQPQQPMTAPDSIDAAVNRSANRALFVGVAVKYLGAARRRDCEILADMMVAAIDRICAAAGGAIAPSSAEVSDAVLQDLGHQMQTHAELIAHVATSSMLELFMRALMAMRGDVAPVAGLS